MNPKNRLEQVAEIAAAVLLVVGCYWVIRPFLGAVAWAAILCFSTWPVYSRLSRVLRNRQPLSATLMTLIVALVIVVPLTLLVLSLTDSITQAVSAIRNLLKQGLPDPPEWVVGFPWIGNILDSHWRNFAHNGENVLVALKQFLSERQDWLLKRSLGLGHGIIQLCLSVFISFFLYRDGTVIVEKLRQTVNRIVGNRTQHLLNITGQTMRGVIFGIIGTAIVQGILAGLGFWLAGVPLPLLLGIITFFVALIPFGPPLVWIPATAWLFYTGNVGWGFFMGIYGVAVISFVDNLLKPYLISRESRMPFIMVFLGVLGGVVAFGFIGVFLGPLLLSIGYAVLQESTAETKGEKKAAVNT